MGPTTEALHFRAGLATGMRCLDAGCGTGVVALGMARQVGPNGQVVGMDNDEAALELARRDAQEQNLPVVFRAESVLDLAEESAYDFVYSRFLLSHLPEPARALRRLARAARHGGVIAIEDVDFDGHFSHPPCPALGRYVELYREVVRRRGADACLGRRLPGLLLDAGLTHVRLEVVQPTFLEGEGKWLAAVTLEHIREAVVAAGLIASAEVDCLVAELDAFALAPRTLMSLPRVFQVWGRVPGG